MKIWFDVIKLFSENIEYPVLSKLISREKEEKRLIHPIQLKRERIYHYTISFMLRTRNGKINKTLLMNSKRKPICRFTRIVPLSSSLPTRAIQIDWLRGENWIQISMEEERKREINMCHNTRYIVLPTDRLLLIVIYPLFILRFRHNKCFYALVITFLLFGRQH